MRNGTYKTKTGENVRVTNTATGTRITHASGKTTFVSKGRN